MSQKVGTGRNTFVILSNVRSSGVANALDVVDTILHGVLRRQVLMLYQGILLEVLEMAAVVWHPEMLQRVMLMQVFFISSYTRFS